MSDVRGRSGRALAFCLPDQPRLSALNSRDWSNEALFVTRATKDNSVRPLEWQI